MGAKEIFGCIVFRDRLHITLSTADHIWLAHIATRAYPAEVCGLLEGSRIEHRINIFRYHPARNLADAADRFKIDSADHIEAQRAARDSGRAIVGCYHSHPNGIAEPSEHDRAGASEHGFVWLIAALAADTPLTLKAFIFNGEHFEPASLDSLDGARV